LTGPRKSVLAGAIILVLAVVFLRTRGVPPRRPNPPGAFSFAVLGDAPYYPWEDVQYPLILREMDAYDLSWVLHVGDIFWRPCTDANYRRVLAWFNGLRHPVIYTPGDNEGVDCWEAVSGGFQPQERIRRIRQIFFPHPTTSLGGTSLPLISQGGDARYPEFVENVRWEHGGILFATVDLVGSRNGTEPATAFGASDVAAAGRRSAAAAAWIEEAFSAAASRQALGVVIGFHANMGLEDPPGDSTRQAYEPFLSVLEEKAESFHGPILLVHGDGHEYRVDHPLVRRSTGLRLGNVTRLQVPGSPRVGWVRVRVAPGASMPFTFEEHVLPRWKYW
jgi:hypothetical protein